MTASLSTSNNSHTCIFNLPEAYSPYFSFLSHKSDFLQKYLWRQRHVNVQAFKLNFIQQLCLQLAMIIHNNHRLIFIF